MPNQGTPRPVAFSLRAALLPTLASATLALTPPAAFAGALGVEDPNMSWGVSSVDDWSTGRPFLDIARLMRPFFGYTTDTWQSMHPDDLRASGVLDADGYPRSIPDGIDGIRTVWAWDPNLGGADRKGIYILSYKGKGTLTLGGEVEIINQSAGRIIFQNTSGGTFWLDITNINPNDHVRGISILRAEDIALHEAGAIFDPDWLEVVADARELRFMVWMQTNDNPVTRWADMPPATAATWGRPSVPVEIMVRLANEAGVDPWFTMPHNAEDDFIRNFATYVRDNLDPRLKAHVEYSNETWNGAFRQFDWLREQAVAEWGNDISEDWETIFAYHTKRATHTARIWEEVYGDAAKDRLVNVLATQATATWVTQVSLAAQAWQDREPDSFIPPSDVFEELAATTYFGASLVANEDSRRDLITRARDQGDAAYPWLYDQLALADRASDSVPAVLSALTEQRDLAHANGMRFTLYEGGQHVHHSFAIEGLSDTQAEELTGFLGGFVRSPEMAALYSLLWDGWRKIGDGPFMNFTDIDAASRWGSWGLLAWPGDAPPRARFILAKQAEGGSWWGEGGGAQYLHGRTASGSESGDRMEGTDEEDYLAGLGGDDTFPASTGRDGINGGDGTDVYILPGPADAYTLTAEGPGHRIEGPDGSAYLIHVEAIEFGDGTRRELD